jgi:glycosyltransferase involved in cell wall biosynthesis
VHILSNSYLSFFLFTFPAITLATLLRKRVILHYHGGAAAQFLQRWFWLARFALRSADKVVVPSRFLSSVFHRYDIETEQVPNILELSSFPFRRRAPLRPRVIIARHLEPAYNVACGIRAFSIFRSRFPDAVLTIAGDGSTKADLVALCRELGISGCVRFVGNVPNEQMHALYDQADICLNSSRVDNQPVSILEAFACGLPVVTTAVGGIPYMVTDREDALLAPNDDPDELAAQMTILLCDPDLGNRLVRNAHSRILEHSWENVYRKLRALYLERRDP